MTGWVHQPDGKDRWRVEKGVLIGKCPPATQIFTKRDDYKDFHARIVAIASKEGEAGFVFRTLYFDEGYIIDRGYNAQINCDPCNGALMGGLARNIRNPEFKTVIPAGKPFTMEVIAIDNHIVIKLNGEISLDYRDENRTRASGHLGLRQISGTEIRFLKVEVKEL